MVVDGKRELTVDPVAGNHDLAAAAVVGITLGQAFGNGYMAICTHAV